MATEFKNVATAIYLAGVKNINVTSNEVTSLAAKGKIDLTKTQSLDVLFPGDIQTYSIAGVSNVGVNVTLFTLSDSIPVGLSYVAGSFMVDGVTKTPTILGNLLTYVFGAWVNGATHTFSFQCERI